MGNSVRITENHIYGNTTGIASDTLSAPGHPGFPADGMQIDNNFIYSNNLDLYGTNPPITPLVPMPIGTGVIWPGMNGAKMMRNWIFDNWRHGAVLAAVPDQVAGEPEGNVDPKVHCTNTTVSTTSCGNRFEEQRHGPGAARLHAGRPRSGSSATSRATASAKVLPNGVDFWWDEFAGNNGNCWIGNTGADGTRGERDRLRATGVPPDPLPSDCESSMGTGDVIKEGVLVDCVTWYEFKGDGAYPLCYWFRHAGAARLARRPREQRAWAAHGPRVRGQPRRPGAGREAPLLRRRQRVR